MLVCCGYKYLKYFLVKKQKKQVTTTSSSSAAEAKLASELQSLRGERGRTRRLRYNCCT